MLLIHQGSAPNPYAADEWARLSEDEQKAVYSAYQAINETPGVQRDGHHREVQDGKTLTTDGPFVAVKEALGGYLFFETEASTLRSSSRRASRRHAWAVRWRCGRW